MDPMTTGLLIALMVASFYFLIIRPNRKRQAEQAKLADSMTPGTRVMLNSGIYGTVTEVGERQVKVEVAPGLQMLVLKQAVLQVITLESQFAEDAVFLDGTAGEDHVIDDPWPLDEPSVEDPWPLEERTDDDDRRDEGQKG
ncbi:preprotein translocase subunit YajC [Granulicoccus sp. GXG6511]|uniref:preprotein translocase subunit YajC n=1 Tax=Granulicoccus sp. GXG6511 TaxID=3381351 RepID=UPI003D7C7D1E